MENYSDICLPNTQFLNNEPKQLDYLRCSREPTNNAPTDSNPRVIPGSGTAVPSASEVAPQIS